MFILYIMYIWADIFLPHTRSHRIYVYLWQVQDVTPITSFDVAGTNLLLGCKNGTIYYIDMQKFPLRMKDNDLLITELFHDVNEHAITALSVYVSPTTSKSIELLKAM